MFILSDRHNIFAFIPFADVTLVIPGIFLYPNPPDVNKILPTPPLAKDEFVMYDKLSVCDDVYDNLSGILLRDKLNDVVPTPNTE